MTGGIRATVAFEEPAVCPVASLSATAETTVDAVTRSVAVGSDASPVSEFALEGSVEVPGSMTEVFGHGETRRIRYSHEAGEGCPCERLGQFGCPVARYVAREGTLTLTFHAVDYDQLQAVVDDLRERYPGMDVRRFLRSPTEVDTRDGVLVDRGKLTERQLEVLETATEMGYFARPREANASEVAAELDVTPSTVQEHLAAAQSKVFSDLL